jgi:hypothetical protein
MADIFEGFKKTWLKGMEAIGNTATNIANNTKQKVDEMNLDNRRREILSDFGLIAYELWQNGMELPKELNDLMVELSQVDEELNTLRAQRISKNAAAEEAAQMQEETPEDELPCLIDEEPKDAQEEETKPEA